jgi:hypothetical protein
MLRNTLFRTGLTRTKRTQTKPTKQMASQREFWFRVTVSTGYEGCDESRVIGPISESQCRRHGTEASPPQEKVDAVVQEITDVWIEPVSEEEARRAL